MTHRNFFVLLSVSIAAAMGTDRVAFAASERLSQVRIESPRARTLAAELEDAYFDVLEGSAGEGSVDLVVSPVELEALRKRGLDPVIIATGHPLQGAASVPSGYPTLDQVIGQMNDTAGAYPGISRLVDLTASLGAPPTIEGRHLYALKISDHPTLDEDEPAFLMVSCHHAREIVTPVLALEAIRKFTTLYGTDPTITGLVDAYEIWIVPVWNPDGYNFVFTTDNLWRKNRHVFPGGIGVDLNRNYPQGWSNGCAGSTDPSSSTYRGPAAASEAETQTMMMLSARERFAKILDYHSAGREVLHGYDCWTHPFDAYLASEATAISTAAGYGGLARPPSAEGENYEWQFALMSAYAFLMETHDEFQPAYASALAEAAQVWPATIFMLQRPLPLWGYVTDASTGSGLSATVSLPGVSFSHGELITSGGPLGRYQAFMPAGTYDVTFAADGYAPRTITAVTVGAGGSTRLDVALASTRTGVAPHETAPPGRDALLPISAGDRPLIRYRIAGTTTVSLDIFDVRGARVRNLVQTSRTSGLYEVTWDGTNNDRCSLGSGLYFAKLKTDGGVVSEKCLLVR